ncbi:Polypeptide N-acetylgalactosaminyltransferase-like 6 [Triplophysa tibetana]|uniref:Polypeptide N-acetylgalactosaminyltransferase n=1 Tax=Triplophysa tibetana TaxID=1572043 RepID=A0A5A9PKR0_9TELE|nr:Polypeptide N-acetylgalactosaminyltransferase-like 6 [Triplophysa tibetana]
MAKTMIILAPLKLSYQRDHLKASLEEFMSRFPKVRIVRTKKREGLIRTRLLGASVARGEVLTFLDSHCEANVNWLPPLLGGRPRDAGTARLVLIGYSVLFMVFERHAGMRPGMYDWSGSAAQARSRDQTVNGGRRAAVNGAVAVISEDNEKELMAVVVPALPKKFQDQIAQNPKTIVCPMIDVIDHNHFGYEAQAGDAMRGAFDWEMYYKRIPIPSELQGPDPSNPYESPVMAGGLFAINRQWFWELGGYDTGLEIWGGEQFEISFKVWMCGGSMYDVPCSRVGHIYRKYVPYKVPSGTSLARNLKRVAETWMDEYTEYIYQRRPEYRHLSTGDLTAQKELRKHLKCKDFKWYMNNVAWDLAKYYPPVEPPPAAWGEIRNAVSGLCVDSKHGSTGTELRLDTCLKEGAERTWAHEQDKTLYHLVSTGCMDCSPGDKRIFMNKCDPQSETQQWIFQRVNATILDKFNSATSS